MNKTIVKLALSFAALVLSAALVVTFSYAWLTMSGSPEVDGIKVSIGGSDTIMVAPDIVSTDSEGNTVHYPGEFTQNLNVSNYEGYAYLYELAGLTPVSTADGVNWVRPAYHDEDSEAVKSGEALLGQLKDISEFEVDTTLEFANLSADELASSNVGNYIYLDFWVVSPGEDYDLRVSTGDANDDSGSFVISRMEAVEDENSDTGYSFKTVNDSTAAAVRVGFLVSNDWSPYADNMEYSSSSAYDSRYSALKGQYLEKGANGVQTHSDFTIYEPNGDMHYSPDVTERYYRLTYPIGVNNGVKYEADVSDRLAVQLSSRWRNVAGEETALIEQIFTSSIIGRDLSGKTPQMLTESFYGEYLQNVIAPYVYRGDFIKNTSDLYAAASTRGYVFDDRPALHALAGATDHAVITTLKKNVPQRIRMFIWLEGQDEDCINYGEVSSFIVNLELAGSNK
ncbi:MAG: hypothetical protein IJC50_08485 [Clostridia bacterium]|nr:hypothetical protein [Clostridia bacterium]